MTSFPIWLPKLMKVATLPDFCTRIIEVLQDNNIVFTHHWGKYSNWAFPGLVDYMYDPKAQEWVLKHLSNRCPEDLDLLSEQLRRLP